MLKESFELPIYFDIGAAFFFGITGALAAYKRGYDIVGLMTLAFVCGVGGALIRDGIFIQQGPPMITLDGRYIVALFSAGLVGMFICRYLERYEAMIAPLDAVGLGSYAVVGVQKALVAGLSTPAAILVGIVNAVGGGLLRDVLSNEEPLFFKPGQFYALAAFGGCLVFVVLSSDVIVPVHYAAFFSIGVTFLLRMLAIHFNWRTSPARVPVVAPVTTEAG